MRRMFLILLFGIVVLCGVFVFLFGTTIGTNLIFTSITNRISGLTFDSVSGFWGNFNIMRMVYHTPELGVIKVDKCNISVNFKYFLVKKIYINNLLLTDVYIDGRESNLEHVSAENIATNKIFRKILKNYSIILKNIVCNNICIMLDEMEFKFQNINTGCILKNNLLRVLPSYISEGFVLYNFFLDDSSNKQTNITLYSAHWIKDLFCIKDVLRNLIDDVLIVIRKKYKFSINFVFTDIQGKDFNFFYNCKNRYVINRFQIQFSCIKEVINSKFHINSSLGYCNGVANIVLGNRYPVYIVVDYYHYAYLKNLNDDQLEQKDLGKIKLMITGSLIDELCVDCDILNIISSTVHILMKIKLKNPTTPIRLLVIGRKIPMFSLGSNKLIFENFNFFLIGNTRNYSIQMHSNLVCSKIAVRYVSMRAQGNSNSCTISELKIKMLNGYCKMIGTIKWGGDRISWNNIYSFNDVNVNQYLKYSTKELSKKIITQDFVNFNVQRLAVLSYPYLQVCRDGSISNDNIIIHNKSVLTERINNRCNISTFILESPLGSDKKGGDNILDLQVRGTHQSRIFGVALEVDMINCSIFSSGLSGNLSIYFGLHGTINSPFILLHIHAQSLNWRSKNISIEKIQINSNINYDALMQSNFFIKLDKVQCRKFALNELLVQGMGDIVRHSLRIILYDKELVGIVNLNGEFDLVNPSWNGRLINTIFFTPIGTWKLINDMIFSYQYTSHKFVFKAHCWESNFCQVSITDRLQRSFLKKISVIINNFNFIFLDLKLIKNVNIYNMRLYFKDVYWNFGEVLPQGSIVYSITRLDMLFCDKENIDFYHIKVNDLICHTTFTATSFSCVSSAEIENDKSYLKFSITDLYNTPKISGNIRLDDMKVGSFFYLLFQSKEYINGLINMNLNFKGYLNSPKFYGMIQFKNCDFNQSNFPFVVQDVFLQINFFGNYAILNGVIQTEHGGQLYLDGKLNSLNSFKNIHLVLNIKGEQINVRISSPSLYAKISTNLICKITTKGIDLTGRIDVPWAKIEFQEFSRNAIEISSEEILLDSSCLRPTLVNKSKNFGIFTISSIFIHLGHDVHFNGLGLYTKLQGDLEISYTNNSNDLLVLGHVKMLSGYFKAYGINLIIKQGQVLFSGAVNQAYLDIEAVKSASFILNSKDPVTVGIHITGVVDQLKLEFLSNSVLLSQQEIASYLLGEYNTTLSKLNTIGNNTITSLLIGMGIERYEKFIGKIGRVLGVQDLTINTQDFIGGGYTKSSVVALSGYIAPGLQIKYGISIVDLLTTVTVRYCINHQLYLEATSRGHDQALDLLYKFNFG
ncbi:conserved hypothetical protein [Candidatus Blochmanniella vafra str. BVAF]|uniref:Translocation and assembly module TamB C-terminal domain-containing protein n=1 Tax=Blochmanniella vafra (strain BVAF) TaxID=859654 RepID=E8Q6Q8_BLOVB|nr:translocation/assembly module TamB domain-containing protein [Candidatus Blochmannia vafer]ADV33499.1 conserved hypothetical protein [Candidatus Blochmannia vafer str. BVAF]